MQTDAAKLVPILAQALHMTPAQVQAMMVKQLPPMAAMLQNLPTMQRDVNGLLGTMSKNVGIFSQVPAGLAHYKPLVTTMQANVDNYKQVNSLPSFRLFTWFFVVPGVLRVLLAAFGLLRRPSARQDRPPPPWPSAHARVRRAHGQARACSHGPCLTDRRP
jgi:hypothetical protein